MTESPQPGYERTDMSVRGVAAVLGSFAVIVAVSVLAIGYGLHALSARDRSTQLPVTRQQSAELTASGPKLQARPYEELRATQAREDKLLTVYAWANPAHSSARIPIERAMTLIAGRTLDEGVRAP